jgi:hypothetical protein
MHVFLTWALVGGESAASSLGRFTRGTHWRGSWAGLRVRLDDVERRKILPLPEIELRPLGRPFTIPTELSQLLRLMLSWEIVAVCCENRRKLTVEFLKVNADVACSYLCALRERIQTFL